MMKQNFNSIQNKEKASDFNKSANQLYTEGKYNEAIELYDRAINLYPNKSAYYTNKGNTLNKIGRYEEALKWFQEAQSIRLEISLCQNFITIS